MRIPSGKTDQLIFFVAISTTDGSRKTGLSSFTVYRSRNGGAATVYTTPTVAELSAANMPGVYALTIDEDTTIASSSDSEEMALHITATGMMPVTRVVELYRRVVTSGRTAAIDSSGRVDVGAVTGTAQTAGDLAALINAVDDYVDTEVAAIKAKTDNLTFTVAGQVDVNVVDWKGSAAPAMTGDAYARLGAPAGASVSADVAAIKSVADAVKAKTDNLPADPADASDLATLFAALTSHGDAVWSTATGFATSAALTTVAAHVTEVWQLQGLDIANPMTVTPTSRVAGTIAQTISGDGSSSSTVTRTA